jgi:hypothetical protein
LDYQTINLYRLHKLCAAGDQDEWKRQCEGNEGRTVSQKHHKACLKRAKLRRARGFVNRREEEEYRLKKAWRNIFVKAGILK